MNILALDPAMKCGYAHSRGLSGMWDFTPKQDESQGMKLIKFRTELNSMLREWPFELLVFEAARGMGYQRALVSAAEFQSVIKVFCLDNEIEHKGYSQAAIKKHATGDGNAPKEDMVGRAEVKWKRVEIVDDNHADALWLLDLAKKEFT